MSSGSLKDLIKAISKAAPELSLPLPDQLLETISIFLEKHNEDNEAEAKGLQDELLAIYKTSILQFPSRLAAFLTILQRLRLVFRDSENLVQWWNQILAPVIDDLEVEPRLTVGTREILLRILLPDDYDTEKTQPEDLQTTSYALVEVLLEKWLSKSKQADEELDYHANFVAGQIQLILFDYGKKNPKNFLTTLNKFFVQPKTRILSLSLLCSFFRDPLPRLHQMLSTPLFINLLRCLQIDTSTRAISLAMTALVMFLPHIPSSTSHHLNALFNIYARLLFWDRRRVREKDLTCKATEEDGGVNRNGWKKLTCLLDSYDESVPEVLHFFTILYGLYPVNFMSYIRKPQKYLHHAKFFEAEELEIQPSEVRQRSEPLRQTHLLHPNFYTYTVENELTDNDRWRKSDAADVVAECMALYVPNKDLHDQILKSKAKSFDAGLGLSDLPSRDEKLIPNFRTRRASESDIQSETAQSLNHPISPPYFGRKLSLDTLTQISQESVANLTAYHQIGTLKPTIKLSCNRLLKKNLYPVNDVIASLALSNHHKSHIDSFLESLSRKSKTSALPFQSEKTNHCSPNSQIAYLQYEIQILRNDLNFERYLKQQHLTHIGQLRRKQMREARIEAETQNVITSNRTLKIKLEEAKRSNAQLKRESEKSKTHFRKWETELSAKLRSLREEQKKWTTERESLIRDFKSASENLSVLKDIIVQTEASELSAKQKAAHAESSLEELKRLRKEVKELTLRVRIYEVNEDATRDARKNQDTAEARVIQLEAELQARDRELIEVKKIFHQEISNLRKQTLASPSSKTFISQELKDNLLTK